jgi:hypothetical protein
MLQSSSNANAFGGTFAVFPNAQSQTKNSKRATKQAHQVRHEMTANNHDRKEGRSTILPESWTRGLVKKSLNLTKRYDQTNPTQIHA